MITPCKILAIQLQELKKLWNTYIARWVAIQHPVSNFDMLQSTEYKKILSEYDQEIPHSQTADNPVAPRGRATQPSRDTKEDKLSKATSSLFPIKMIAILEWT